MAYTGEEADREICQAAWRIDAFNVKPDPDSAHMLPSTIAANSELTP